ncbi:MAG: LytTR family DNA-binding domain-containing protein [Cellvibrionaceae bacterium]|nr:LytTR family DNA-binding domain-containing protein [Cellvibrionaceae bacterium]
MHLLIVDDEPLARQRLLRMVEQLDGCEVVGEAGNGEEAIRRIEEVDPDIVLMDVRMPGTDGLSAAHNISQMEAPPALIFCTAYDEYALEAFETLAVGYLLKPVAADTLAAVIDKAKKTTKLQNKSLATPPQPQDVRKNIVSKTRQGMELISIESIYCFLADQKYVTVVHSDGETLIDDTLKELEQEFSTRFIRVHRNALVAVNKIEGMKRVGNSQFEIQLKGTEFRPSVSRRHIAGVRELLSQL